MAFATKIEDVTFAIEMCRTIVLYLLLSSFIFFYLLSLANDFLFQQFFDHTAWNTMFLMAFTFVGEPLRPHWFTSPSTSATLHWLSVSSGRCSYR